MSKDFSPKVLSSACDCEWQWSQDWREWLIPFNSLSDLLWGVWGKTKNTNRDNNNWRMRQDKLCNCYVLTVLFIIIFQKSKVLQNNVSFRRAMVWSGHASCLMIHNSNSKVFILLLLNRLRHRTHQRQHFAYEEINIYTWERLTLVLSLHEIENELRPET